MVDEMLHANFHIHTLTLGPRPIPLRMATLLVVARAESAALDWEVVAHTVEREPVANAAHPLAMSCITGADGGGALEFTRYDGDAILVRAVDNALVFRGIGVLNGFDLATLRG